MEMSAGDGNTDHQDAASFYCQSTIEFQNALKSSIENILNRVTDDKFVEIYKDCYKGFEKKDDIERPSLSGSSTEARKYRKQFNAMVTQNASEMISETLTASIDDKLKELEEVKQEQLDTSFQWRPPGDAHKHMMLFDIVSKIEEKKQYENCIEKEREVINLLKMRLAQKRLKAKHLHNLLQTSFQRIENAVVVPAPPEEPEENETH